MTMNLGYGFDAELNYRQERLRADFRHAHATNTPRWWQRRPTAAVVAHRTPTAVGVQHGAKAGTASTVEVAPVAVEPVVVRRRPPNSTDIRARAA